MVAIRWIHALAAVAWVGGSIFYLLALRPGLRNSAAPGDVERNVVVEFRGLVNTAIAALLISGVILTLSRLTSDAASLAYVGVLAAKVALAFYMFFAVWMMQRGRRRDNQEGGGQSSLGTIARLRSRLTSPAAVLVGGIVVIGLADVLGFLFERGLAG